MLAVLEKTYSLAEYLELERTSEIRHEFVDGKLIPMAGESKAANKIANNILRTLATPLEAKKLEVYTHEVRVMVEAEKRYRYPDLVIAPESDDEDTHAITQPVLIAEVISDGTAAVDRGDKLREYCALESMQYYLIIEQDAPQIQFYAREGERWVLGFLDGLEEVLDLPVFEERLLLTAIYRKVKFQD